MPGHFFAIDGLDGCGGETQTKILLERLKKSGKDTLFIRYPDYGPDKENPAKPIAKIIHEFLHKKYEFDEKVQFLLYSTDMVKDIQKMQNSLNEGKIIVADRYFTSALAYQCLKGFPLKKALKYADMFGLPKPDLIIFIDISAETSIKRKHGEKMGNLDRHEEDKKFLERLANFYKEKLAKKNVFGKWMVIDGEKSIEEVSEEIWNIVKEKLNI